MGFLLSRRWVLFALVVALAAWGAVRLGEWQFHRLAERKHSNHVIGRNLEATPVPIEDVMSSDHPPRADDEWRRVTVHGTWDAAHTIVLKYQTRDSGPGIDVVTPLETANGSAVLVDRGWMVSENSGASRPKLPATADGMVTVTGYVRRDATGGATVVDHLATRAISSRTAGQVLPYPLYRGFLDLEVESPKPPARLGAVELPDHTGDGPHFFYGLQWWFFGVLAVFGFFYLAWDEVRKRRREESQGPEHASVDREHRPVHEG